MSQRQHLTTDKKNTHIFKAPMPGIVYLSATPTDKPYVEIGQSVKAGDTICLIEAMKMFTVIKADRDGIITRRHVDNATFINHSSSLFTMQIPSPKTTALFSFINELKHRTNLNAQENDLIIKLKNLKDYLTVNPVANFEDCAGKLHTAVSSAFLRDKNINSTLGELDIAWAKYWKGIADTHNRHAKLKKLMIGIFTTLGAIAGCILGMAIAPFVWPYSGAGGLVVGSVAGGFFGNWLADCCFFSRSNDKLDAAVKLSGKISEIKDDIGIVSACR